MLIEIAKKLTSLTWIETSDLFDNIQFHFNKKFIETELTSAANFKASFFAPYRIKAENLLADCNGTMDKQTLEEKLKQQQSQKGNEGFCELLVNHHVNRLGKF